MSENNELEKTIEDYEKDHDDLDPKEKEKLIKSLETLQKLLDVE